MNSSIPPPPSPPAIVLATNNTHKIQEFVAISAALSWAVCWQSAKSLGGMPPIDETGATYAANAKSKALALAQYLPKDGWVLADDSGLEVDALDGRPGLLSARFAGSDATSDDNNRMLLSAMAEIPPQGRNARFVCWLCLADRQGHCVFFTGHCCGTIRTRPAGSGGFGYDPLFQPSGYNQTFAELAEGEKHRISHRAKALAQLAVWWKIRIGKESDARRSDGLSSPG